MLCTRSDGRDSVTREYNIMYLVYILIRILNNYRNDKKKSTYEYNFILNSYQNFREDSWLKLSDLGNAPEALAEWEAKKEKAAQKKAERAKARAEKAAAKKAERVAQPKKPKGKQAKKPANDKPAEKPAES